MLLARGDPKRYSHEIAGLTENTATVGDHGKPLRLVCYFSRKACTCAAFAQVEVLHIAVRTKASEMNRTL